MNLKLKLVLGLSLLLLIGLLLIQYRPIYHDTTHYITSPSSPLTVAAPVSLVYNNTEHRQRFPQAIIIGVRKAGTRALLNMLNLHPTVVSAKQEVHYFNKEDHYDQGIKWYLNAMPYTNPDQLTIEKTPAYFVGEEVPQRMHSILPDVKLLLIVRDPIERAVSDFVQLNTGKRAKSDVRFEDLAFVGSSDAVNTNYSPIKVSIYHKHFKNWLKYYPLSQLHIVDGDALIKNPVPELKRVETFLNISNYFTEDMFQFNETKGFYCWKRHTKIRAETMHCLGSSKGREHPDISDRAVHALKEFFREHNEQFYTLSHKRFNW